MLLYKYSINGNFVDIIDLNLDYYCKIIPSNDDMFYIAEPTRISNDGNLIWGYSITDKYNLQLTGLISLFIDYETNYLYILNSDILLILTSDGKLINLFHLEDYINSNSKASNILKTPNGQIIFEVSATNNISYYEVDLIKKTIVEYNMPNIHENFVNVYYDLNDDGGKNKCWYIEMTAEMDMIESLDVGRVFVDVITGKLTLGAFTC